MHMRLPALSLAILGAVLALAVALEGGSRDAQSAFPGVNGRIAFSSARSGEPEIYTMNSDGSDQQPLFVDPDLRDGAAKLSADGNRFVFQRYNFFGTVNLWLIDPDGNNLTQLTFDPGEENNPSWSPDGIAIAFESFQVDHYQIAKINADGSSETELSNNPYNDEFPSWSPNGDLIAFNSDRDGHREIYLMSTDGTGQTRLTYGAGGNQWGPSWSPDGTKIAYWTDVDGDSDINVIGVDGLGNKTLTNNDQDDVAPAWSPDGTMIAFDRWDGVTKQIFTISAEDGSNEQQLTNTVVGNYQADWTRLALAPTPTPVPTLAPNVQGNTDCASGVNATDMLNIVANFQALMTLPCTENADVNCDQSVNLLDALDIGRWLIGTGLVMGTPNGCRPIGAA